jgi:hypothetical protein
MSDQPSGNQWYFNGALIAGATSQQYVAHATGWYWDQVSINNCYSDTSNHIYVVITRIEKNDPFRVTIMPVPNDGHFTIAIESGLPQAFRAFIFNSLGVQVWSSVEQPSAACIKIPVDLGYLPVGMYTVIITSEDKTVIRKVVVTK